MMSSTSTKKPWMNVAAMILMMGRMLILKTTFFTRYSYSRSAIMPLVRASEK